MQFLRRPRNEMEAAAIGAWITNTRERAVTILQCKWAEVFNRHPSSTA